MRDETGLGWWTIPGDPNEVFLVVEHGRVVDCTPHAKRWALNRTAAQIEERALQCDAMVTFTPLSAAPRRILSHLEPVVWLRQWTIVGYWQRERRLMFGRLGDRWVLEDTDEVGGHAWAYALREECEAELERRKAGSDWTERPVGRGQPLPDSDLSS